MSLHQLANHHWQAGILPDTGASVAFGRIHTGGAWRDLLRPTAEADYGNPGTCASFIMLPWCNRIRNGVLRFDGAEYQLQTAREDGTARHGDVRGRAWEVVSADAMHIQMRFDSARHDNVNWPFRFTAEASYQLDGREFIWTLSLRNGDTRSMPGGFGQHPYFARKPQSIEIPCRAMFALLDYMAYAPPVPVTPELDFCAAKPMGDTVYGDLFTDRDGDRPARLIYDGYEIEMACDALYRHLLLYTPPGEATFALEPMTNASDGFNLHERGMKEAGVFVLEPGEAARAAMRLTLKS